MKRFILNITGKVQGVWYRKSAQQKAKLLQLNGFAENKPNGTVYIEVEGDIESIFHFVNWCKKGPDQAMVENVKMAEEKIFGYDSFEIK
jgi:acylphosphatase